jgi:hypothetical protein
MLDSFSINRLRLDEAKKQTALLEKIENKMASKEKME